MSNNLVIKTPITFVKGTLKAVIVDKSFCTSSFSFLHPIHPQIWSILEQAFQCNVLSNRTDRQMYYMVSHVHWGGEWAKGYHQCVIMLSTNQPCHMEMVVALYHLHVSCPFNWVMTLTCMLIIWSMEMCSSGAIATLMDLLLAPFLFIILGECTEEASSAFWRLDLCKWL